MVQPSAPDSGPLSSRSYSFQNTPAVATSRARHRYVNCSLCRADHSEYLFYRTGVRFVRCRSCGLVYVSPLGEGAVNYFDMQRSARFATPLDRRLAASDFGRFLDAVAQEYERRAGSPPRRTLLLGRWLPEFAELPAARRIGLSLVPIDDRAFAALSGSSSLELLDAASEQAPDLVIVHELLEGCGDPAEVVARLAARLASARVFAVSYANVESLPARVLRRHWPAFFEVKTVFFSLGNLSAMWARAGFALRGQFPFPTTRSLSYVLGRVAPERTPPPLLEQALARVPMPVRAGHQVALFERRAEAAARPEKLSIVLPVYNEAATVREVIEALLRKRLPIDKELLIVESNSRDGTREIVREYEGRPELSVIYEGRPRGKGHAVRTGLRAASGSIILIQDADFEYDIDDYDALLEPILQRRSDFVLGSRTLGLNDWKVRRFAQGALKGALMNLAQVGFARTFNLLYQQRTTDVNTMFKVFRRECLDAFELESDGFDLDIELVCKLVRSGYAPIEVPVNYVSRDFAQGKKIDFWRDAFPSYSAFFRYRFGTHQA